MVNNKMQHNHILQHNHKKMLDKRNNSTYNSNIITREGDNIMKGNQAITTATEINEQEAIILLNIYRKYPADKKAIAIAFIQGMDTQKAISEAESNYAVQRYAN